MDSLTHAVILSVPLIIAGGLHMAAVRLDVLQALKIPISRRWFGANKTWRGVVVMALTAALGVKLATTVWPDHFGGWNPFALGALLGLAYAVSELPNSFVKRRLKIDPGKRPPRNKTWFVIADQADSAIGCALVYGLALRLAVSTVLLLVVVGPAIHLIVNYSLYLLRLRKEPV